jgi:glycosyltransferase involved in cell wall biosynthesis
VSSVAAPVVLLTGDAVGERMAGPAIRAVELARSLIRAGIAARVVTPTLRSGGPVDVEVVEAATRAEIEPHVLSASAVVGFAPVVAEHPWIGEADVPLCVDAYDPGLFETLERFRGAPVNEQRGWVAAAQRHLVGPMEVADLVLVASERQRHLTLGLLAAAGRINGRTVAEDPTLRGLCLVVPFGTAADPPSSNGDRPIRDGFGLGSDAVVALWGGGLYDWLDPIALVDAVARCDDPNVVAVFLAGPHPTDVVGRSPLVERARARADELGVLGRRALFAEQWVPYDSRGAWLVDADIGVSLHHDHVETTYAFRTRILDYLWAGLPVLCSAGDHFAEVVAADDLGIVVPVDDVDAVADALSALASAPADERAARRARALAAADDLRWDKVAEPLVRWCRDPELAPDRRVGADPVGWRGRAALWLRRG